jgi:hypothetical protein
MMSGVAVVWYLLKTNSPILAVMPAAQIMPGEAPLGAPKPLLLINEIDSHAFKTVRREATRIRTERVQVSALSNSPAASVPGVGYPQVKSLLMMARTACRNKRGTINSVLVDSITDEGEGPDLFDEVTQLHSQSTDFFVRWIE